MQRFNLLLAALVVLGTVSIVAAQTAAPPPAWVSASRATPNSD